MLITIDTRPNTTLNEVAKVLGCSERTVQRWWKLYREGGLRALLDLEEVPPPVAPPAVEDLLPELRRRGIKDVGALRAWLKERTGGDYSGDAIADLLVRSVHAETKAAPGNAKEGYPDQTELMERLPAFLNNLPMTTVHTEWMNHLRLSLLRLLPDVDVVCVNLVLSHNLAKDSDRNTVFNVPAVALRFFIPTATNNGARITPSAVSHLDPTTLDVIKNMVDYGFPLERYHSPTIYYYYIAPASNRRIGALLIFRECNKPPISESTLLFMGTMRPFFSFLLSDGIARVHERSIDDIIHDRISTMFTEYGLSLQEKRVMVLLTRGYSYTRIAESIGISPKTVKTHCSNIYAKVGVSSQIELMGKVFLGREDVKEFERAAAESNP